MVHAGFSCSRLRRIGFDALGGLEPVLGGLQAKTRRASARHGPPSTVVRRSLRRNAFGRKPSRRELKPSRQCRRATRTRKKESRTAAPHELAPGRTTLDPNQEKVCLERTDDPRTASSQEKGRANCWLMGQMRQPGRHLFSDLHRNTFTDFLDVLLSKKNFLLIENIGTNRVIRPDWSLHGLRARAEEGSPSLG